VLLCSIESGEYDYIGFPRKDKLVAHARKEYENIAAPLTTAT
jgi:hypothetical protein